VKIVVATDSFKGSASARAACSAVERGVLSVLPEAEVVLRPMADGGEGTAETLLEAGGGAWRDVRVAGPLPGTTAEAGFLWLPERGPGALVEMAVASGLELLRPEDLDPLAATTRGTGELVSRALADGARRVWLAIGGSATVDGGVGMASALGWRFLDAHGREVGLGGAELERIERIERPPQPIDVTVEVLCDVDNPLLGPNGAARVFGPQKGATPPVVERLEGGLANLARVIERDLGVDVTGVPGGGAAGGLGAGAVAFLDATLVSGVTAVMDAAGLDDALVGADWVLTGEGRYDEQSLRGKVVSGVVERARRAGVKVGVIAGQVAMDTSRGGVDVVEQVSPLGMPLAEALGRGEELIESAAARVARAALLPT